MTERKGGMVEIRIGASRNYELEDSSLTFLTAPQDGLQPEIHRTRLMRREELKLRKKQV